MQQISYQCTPFFSFYSAVSQKMHTIERFFLKCVGSYSPHSEHENWDVNLFPSLVFSYLSLPWAFPLAEYHPLSEDRYFSFSILSDASQLFWIYSKFLKKSIIKANFSESGYCLKHCDRDHWNLLMSACSSVSLSLPVATFDPWAGLANGM